MPAKKDSMSIRDFDAFASERRAFKNLPLSILKDTTLGIDVDYFVTKALNSHRREPLVHAIGGFPVGVESIIDTLVEALKSNGVKPLFVIRGLELAPIEPPFSSDAKLLQRSQAWALYERGDGEEAVKSFDDTPVELERASRPIVKMMVKKGLEYMVAPFTSSAQLSYLLENEYIDAVYGSSDALMYNVDKLITHIDTRNGNFQWINKRNILHELSMTQEQFVEAGIAAGCELNKVTFPPVDHMINAQPIAPITAMKAIQDLTHAHMSMYAAIMAFPDPESSPSFAERFRKALAAVQYQPVLKDNGKIEPLDSNDVPNNIHEFIGQRLPDEILFYFSKGLIGPELLNALSTGVYLQPAPLDGGESKQYREFLTKLHPIRSKAQNFLTQTMHRYYQYKPAKSVAWYDRKEKEFEKVNPPLHVTIGSKWKVEQDTLKSKYSTPSIANAFISLFDLAFVEKSLDVDKNKKLTTNLEIVSNAIYRSLHTLEFVNNDHELTGWGNVVQVAIKEQPELAEQLMVLLTLFKMGYLNGNALDPDYTGGPIRGTAEDKTYTTLLSRVATAINSEHKSMGYTGPLSRNILAYHSFVAAQTRVFRNLIEGALVALLANDDADRLARDTDEWNSLVPLIPFCEIPNSVAGIAMKTYLDEVVNSDVAKSRANLPKLFKQTAHIEQDIKQVFGLWDALLVGVRKAKSLSLVKDIDQFEKADAWLKSKRF